MIRGIWTMWLVTQKMPFDNLKSQWKLLNGLGLFFVGAFYFIARAIVNEDLVQLEWLTSLIFFFGAIYVLFMSRIIYKTVGALNISELRTTLMIEEIQDYAIILIDVDGNILSWNKGAQHIKGYTTEEIIGKHFSIFYTPEDISHQRPQRLITIAIERGKATDEGYRVRKDGTRFWGTISISAVHDDKGKILGFSKVTRDYTERKMAEEKMKLLNESLEQTVLQRTQELREVNGELSTFAYTVAHDLQSPLRVMSGFAGVLLKESLDKLDADAQECLTFIDQSAKRMGRLIMAMLNFSKLGKEEITKKEVDMTTLANDNKPAVMPHAGSAEIIVHELPPAFCDPILIGQVWQNLIDNAVKYSAQKPHPKVEIGSQVMEGKNIYYVKDNGAGFDMKYANNLFGAFKRMHSDEEFEGTGIGLATVHKIITKHGGKVWAEAVKDEGACFYFSLDASS